MQNTEFTNIFKQCLQRQTEFMHLKIIFKTADLAKPFELILIDHYKAQETNCFPRRLFIYLLLRTMTVKLWRYMRHLKFVTF